MIKIAEVTLSAPVSELKAELASRRAPATRASLIEAAARRMFVRMVYNPEEDVLPWEEQPHETRQWYRDFAEAAFAFPPGEAWIAPWRLTKFMSLAVNWAIDEDIYAGLRDAHLKETEEGMPDGS